MKKMLLLTNGNKPSEAEYNYIGEEKITNFTIPSVNVATGMGYDVTIGVNRRYADKLSCIYPVSFYNAEIYRNPFSIKEMRRAYKNACKEISSADYLAIHCNTPIGGMVGRLAGKKHKVKKIVYTAHGFHFYKGAPLFNRTVLKWAEQIMAHWTDAIITMNAEDYEAAKKFRLKKGGKVYFVHGVGITLSDFVGVGDKRNEKRAELNLNDDDIALVSAGDLILRKDYATAIRAIALADNENLHYFICGVGPERENLEELAKELGVENQIHFLGFRSDVKELMAASDIFLFTTLQEGMPRSMMEAMATGLPCVASAIRGNVDLIENGENGYVCAAKDVEAFSKAISKLAQSKELREEISKKNLEKIKGYDVSVVEKEIKAIYEEVLSK